MLRIKRAVQASFNTENSFIAAQAAAAQKGTEKPTDAAKAAAKDAADPMAAMEREMESSSAAPSRAKGAPAFVASTLQKQNANGIDEAEGGADGAVVNPDAIAVDDDDL